MKAHEAKVGKANVELGFWVGGEPKLGQGAMLWPMAGNGAGMCQEGEAGVGERVSLGAGLTNQQRNARILGNGAGMGGEIRDQGERRGRGILAKGNPADEGAACVRVENPQSGETGRCKQMLCECDGLGIGWANGRGGLAHDSRISVGCGCAKGVRSVAKG